MSGRGLRRLLWLTALICAACLDLRAQRLPIKIYTTADGLAHNAVNRIVKDSRGFLWFCTAGGLSRFDGYAFTNFSTEQGWQPLLVGREKVVVRTSRLRSRRR